MALVYQAKSRTSGGVYVGITARSLKRRRAEHIGEAMRGSSKCPAFAAALRKHGPEDFDWTVLADDLTIEDAARMEAFIVSTTQPRYNSAPGGRLQDHVIGMRARAVVNLLTGQTHASAKDAAKASGVTPSRISQLCNQGGRTKTGVGFRYADSVEAIRAVRSAEEIQAGRRSRIEKLKARRHPPETIERMKSAAKLRGVSAKTREIGNAKKRKPIVCIQTGTVFADAAAAGLAHGVDRQHVYNQMHSVYPSRLAGVSFRHALPHESDMMNVREAV